MLTRRHGWMTLAAAASALAASVLYRQPPLETSLYPRCPFHEFTGLLCPGCGITRALYALLHGHLHEAVHWNALLILVVLPLLTLYLATALRRGSWPTVRRRAIAAALLVTLCFTILRNLTHGAP